jgi:hypothetical protein
MSQEKAVRLEETATNALKLIEKYAEDDEAFLENPKDMFDDLNRTKKDMQDAWRDVKEENDKNNTAKETAEIPEPADFRSSYVEMITGAFEAPLEAMRQQQEAAGANDIDVNILVECMQSGVNLLNPEEKQFFLDELQAIEHKEEQEHEEPYHTIRRRELGYDVKLP